MFIMTCMPYQPDAKTLRDILHAARARTLDFAGRLAPGQWLGPQLSIINPPLWEIGHVGWFQEHWCLRYQADAVLRPSMLEGADELYNSAMVAHDTRWQLPLPTVEQTLTYLRAVLDGVLARLASEGATEHLRYFVQLAAFHEEMHNEAFHYTSQTLEYAAEKTQQKQDFISTPCTGDAAIAGGRFLLGAQPSNGFVFDNEKWAHEVDVRPFRMARTAVTNAEFVAFVDDGGYHRRECWSNEGWQWRAQANATMPVYWVKRDAAWHVRRFDQTLPILPRAAVIHVNWYEAEAYCLWARRRQQREDEWE